jgi:type II secretory pathway pseudopilin PulG
MIRAKSGMMLLEVILAIAILAVAGSAMLGGLLQSFHAVHQAGEAESEVIEAAAFLDAVTLWSRSELDQRLGERRQGRWWLTISRPAVTLYVIGVADSAHRPILQTAIYRPEPDDAP